MARPSKYKDNFPNLLLDHMGKGFSFESFAALVGVTEETIHDWTRSKLADGTDNPRYKAEFSESKKEGLIKARLFWERIGVNMTLGMPLTWIDDKGVEHKTEKYNVTAWIFNMKNRFGWRDRQDVTSGDAPVDYSGHDALKEIAEAIKNATRSNPPNDPTAGGAGAGEPGLPEDASESPS